MLRLRAGDGSSAGALQQGTRIGRGDAGARDPFSPRHVCLSDDGEPVLAGFDLTIPAGSSLAIVGQNGAGKTTIAKLLCRLYDPQEGAIEVDGVDLRDSRPRRLAVAADRRVSRLHPLRAAAARQRGSRRCARRRDPGGPRRGRGRGISPVSTRCWHAATPAAPIFGRPMAARRTGPRALRRAARRRRGPAR